MEDMIIDLDIEDDLIKKFLLHKLEEIKLNNTELEQQISRRKELLNICVNKIASEVNQNVLEISGTWHKNLNGKWIVGIEVKNTSSSGSAKNISVLLNWDSSTPLIYTIKTFRRYKAPEQEKSALRENLKKIAKVFEKSDIEEVHPLKDEWIPSDEITDDLSIILAFDTPQFIDKLEYEISGILSYQFNEKRCELNIPSFKVASPEVINNEHTVKHVDVINGCEKAYLSTLIANEETELIARVSENVYNSLEKILEIELMFKKANIRSRKKTFFYVDNITVSNDACLLMLEKEDHNLYSLTIFTRDQSSLHLMLHFLYKHIPNVIILPKKYKENLLAIQYPLTDFLTQQQTHQKVVALKSVLKEFGESLELQLDLVEMFHTNHLDNLSEETVEDKNEVDLNVDIQNYQCFRKELTDLEFNSDLLHAKMIKLAGNSESPIEVDVE